MMMKERLHYIWERTYPHVIALIMMLILIILGFHPTKSSKINELVDGIVTLDSIIIGFIGAIIPVILSMKNESKLVKYVFEKDEEGLFKKYISETIAYGLTDVCVALSVYVKDVISSKYVLIFLEWLFIYVVILFILSTYRSMTCMLKLIFTDDRKIDTEQITTLEKQKKNDLWEAKGK